MVDRGSPVPPYKQIAEQIRGQITSGELQPGTALPSILRMSGEYQVSEFTVKKALRLLKAEGLITGVAGYGTFVARGG